HPSCLYAEAVGPPKPRVAVLRAPWVTVERSPVQFIFRGHPVIEAWPSGLRGHCERGFCERGQPSFVLSSLDRHDPLVAGWPRSPCAPPNRPFLGDCLIRMASQDAAWRLLDLSASKCL